MIRNDLNSVRLADLPAHIRDDGELVVAEGLKDIPFAIARMFTVRAGGGVVRGRHAHKRCTQFLICAYGAVDVEGDDGTAKKVFSLENDRQGLLVPPGIWTAETYKTKKALLIVLCDRGYEEDDYIRDHEAFLAWRARNQP